MLLSRLLQSLLLQLFSQLLMLLLLLLLQAPAGVRRAAAAAAPAANASSEKKDCYVALFITRVDAPFKEKMMRAMQLQKSKRADQTRNASHLGFLF